MSTIRRQSIISSGVIYIGFAIGALNTFLFAKWVTPAQYGLVGMFVALSTIMYYIANLGMPFYIGKFFPYYHDNVVIRKNDMMTWATIVSLVGFLLVVVLGIVFKPQVIKQFGKNSPELVHYYYWIFPFGLGTTFFSLFEALGWQLRKSILTNFLREVLFRVSTFTLLLLLFLGIIHGFDIFIKIYACSYIVMALILVTIQVRSGDLHFVFTPSRVTRKFFAKIRAVVLMSWSGAVVYNIAFFFGQVVIAAVVPGGLAFVAVYTIAQYGASLVQAPQRGIIAASMGPLSRAWKDKDMGRIQRIYVRSSINQLIFSIALFLLIWLNFRDAVLTFGLPRDYLAAQYVFLFIGLTRVVDMGTGVNTQILITSIYWRIDLFTGLVLVLFTLPLNYWLAKKVGVTGPAIADLITFFAYNALRWAFLYRKFKLQPFNLKTLYTLLLGVAVYLICQYLFGYRQGIGWMFARSVVFIGLFGAGVLGLRLSEDVMPVWATLKQRGLRIIGRGPGPNR